MAYDRSMRMYDEGYPPDKLDELISKGNIHKGKFLNERFHYSQYLQMKKIYDLSVNSVLEIGPGEAFVATYMRSLGITYDTLDSDESSNPTIVSDLRNWDPPFQKWELVAAFQVLEHMPYSSFESNLDKLIQASSRWVFISLPYHCFGFRLKGFLSFGQMKRYNFNMSLHFPTFFKNRKYREEYMKEFPFAVHFWEIGRRPFYSGKLEKIFSEKNLKVTEKFHSENPYHYFYLLEKS